MDLKEALEAYGLTEKEAKVYLATTELGSATVNTIAKRSGVFRTYCYDILRSLSERGLVAHMIKKGTAHYETPNPEIMLELLRKKQDAIEEAIPRLAALRATAEVKPRTHIFEGRGGVIAVHEDILKTEKDTIVLGNTERIIKELGPYFERYVKARTQKRIKARVLTDPGSVANERLSGRSVKELREYRQTPMLKGLTTTTYIYGDKVAMITYEKEIFGVVIENEAIANTQRAFFEVLWRSAHRRE